MGDKYQRVETLYIPTNLACCETTKCGKISYPYLLYLMFPLVKWWFCSHGSSKCTHNWQVSSKKSSRSISHHAKCMKSKNFPWQIKEWTLTSTSCFPFVTYTTNRTEADEHVAQLTWRERLVRKGRSGCGRHWVFSCPKWSEMITEAEDVWEEHWGDCGGKWHSTCKSKVQTGQEGRNPNLMLTPRFLMISRDLE